MMNKITLFGFAILIFSCSPKELKKAEDAQTAGREFIRASLDGDFDTARFFLLKDDDNNYVLNRMETKYNQMSVEAKRLYREANIRPVSITAVNDSLTTYTYYHTSNPKDTVNLSIVKKNGEWLVDAKSVLEK
jgi:hypothetical protein